MEHISIVKMQLKFPFIYAEYEDGKKFKYDINEMIVFYTLNMNQKIIKK